MSDILPPDLRDLLIRIDARLGSIIADIGELKADAKATREEISKTRESVAFMRGRLESIPTFWQSFAIIFGVLIGLPAVATIAVWLLHFSGIL